MRDVKLNIKEWLPAIGSLCLVVAAVIYAVSRTAAVSREIRSMDELAATLSDKATNVKAGVRTREELEALHARRNDLEARLSDSQKPGLIVSQLSEAARTASLQVLEIQPLAPSPAARPAASADSRAMPLLNYRVSVKGAYQEIAAYLRECTAQRIPVRVIGLEMGALDEQGGAGGDALRADITVEAFQPSLAKPEAAQGT